MRYKEGINRNQYMLLPNRIEDYVSEDSLPVLIEVYVESLDMVGLGIKKSIPKETGRPPYNPKDMLKLYIYGLMNNIRSSRNLERETHRNIELIWLMKNLKPDHKSIAEFRRENTEGIKNVSKELIKICYKTELISGETIAIDGTKIKASNAKDKNYTTEKLKIMEERAAKKIEEYEKGIEEADMSGNAEEVSGIKEKIEEMKEKKARYENIRKEIKESGEKQVSEIDKDSRKMKTKDGQMMSYNCQAAVDSKNNMIIAFEVTTEGSDRNQLGNMTRKAKEVLEKKEIEILADTGYMNGPEIKRLEEEGAKVYVSLPKANEETMGGKIKYTKDKFKYDKEKDIYKCPTGVELEYCHKKTDNGKVFGIYKSKKCKDCPEREKCTSSKEGRSIHRWENEEVIERMEKRVEENPEKLRQRKSIIEHVFGCIKSSYNQGYFLMRGKDKVESEFAMSVLTHNMKRCISLLGIRKMIEMM